MAMTLGDFKKLSEELPDDTLVMILDNTHNNYGTVPHYKVSKMTRLDNGNTYAGQIGLLGPIDDILFAEERRGETVTAVILSCPEGSDCEVQGRVC